MRRILLIISLLVIGSINLFAQDYYRKNEIEFSCSQFTLGQTVYVLGDVFVTAFSLGHATVQDPTFSGCMALGYYRRVSRVVSVGGVFAFESINGTVVNTDRDITGNYDMMFFSLIPAIKARWFETSHFSMYSRGGLGLTVYAGEESSLIPAVQLSPVCFDVGENGLYGFAEIGFGTQGLATVGVKYEF